VVPERKSAGSAVRRGTNSRVTVGTGGTGEVEVVVEKRGAAQRRGRTNAEVAAAAAVAVTRAVAERTVRESIVTGANNKRESVVLVEGRTNK